MTYTITFTDELGTASDETGSEITQAAEGTLVTITAKDRAEEGLLFTAWQAPEGLELADDTEEITTFTMPGSNVELAAEYAPLPEDAEALAEEEEIMLADASPVSGDGTESDPYQVSTYEQLKTVVDKGEAKVKLIANIDTTGENGGAGVTNQSVLKFFGNDNILDLNGHTLKLVSNTGATFIYVNKDLTIKDSQGGGRINFEYGPNVMHKTTAIYVSHASNEDIAHLTVESGTLSSTKGGITLIESIGNLTINGGKFYAPYVEGSGGTYAIHTIHQYNDNAKTIITGGEIDGVVRIQRTDSAATGTPNYGDIPVQIKGGTFKQHVQLRWTEKGEPSGYPTEFSPAVEIAGGIFEKRINPIENGLRGTKLSTKLTGGTFKAYTNLGLGKGDSTGTDYKYYLKSLGNSIIMRGNEIRTSCDWSEADWFNASFGGIYGGIYLDGSESNPVTVIPNAWGMKSVTLDGTEINYAKDWKGEVERMDNSTAHTLKFEWYPLASELVNAGYSYNARCEHYISGSSAVQQTDTIDANNKLWHTVTIPAGADPKVYSFALHLNLQKDGSSVGIMSNEHIVKLVVDPAPVVQPDPTIEGNVYYTSGIVFGRRISTGTGNLPTGFDSSKLLYQWQRSTDGGSTWADIDGATRGSYTPVAADMGDTVRIRVKITAEGYLGEIVGAPVKVSKAANDNTPAPPAVEAQKDDSNAYTKFKISDFNSNQEYVYTSSPASGSEWPTSGTQITSATVDNLPGGSTYYIYTRYKETDTHTAGSKISSSSVLLDDETKLNRIILTDENGKVYGTYGNGNTIYIKKGTSMTLTATTNPSGANKWSAFTFKSQYNASAPFTVTAPTGPVASGAAIPTVTIHGDTAGTGTLAAEYSGYSAAQSYGTWRVHVYENVSDIGTDAEITVSPSFPDMTMYVGETMPLPEYNVDVYPEGALENYDLAWRIIKVGMGAAYSESDENITLENDEIKATKKHTGSENTRIALVAINKANNYISSLSSFYVTVTEAPTVELTGLTVAPAKVNLELNATYQLSAVKEPVNAAGSLNWESSNTSVATVDNTGKVTAKAQGTAMITVTCGDKSASCTVMVAHTHDYDGQPYLYLDPGSHYQKCKANDGAYNTKAHDFSAWTPNADGNTHSRTCSKCKKAGETANYTETAIHNWQWVVDTVATPNAAGKKHEECTDCHATRKENTEIPMMTSIKVEHLTVAKPAKDALAEAATTTDSAYTVANTQWKAADGSTLAVGEKFKPGTVYTAHITLHSNSDAVFSANSTFNAIDGKNAAVAGGALTGDSYAYSIVLTYTFDATEGVHQHTYGAWSSDDTHHWHECTDASCPDKAASVIDKAEHNFVWKIDVPASQASTGTKHEECTVCGKKRNENTVIDKLPGSSSGSHHSSSNNNNNNTGTEAAAPEAAAPAPAASAPVTTTTSARTGDSSNLIGWLAVLLISGGAAGAWYTVAKKKKEQ